MTNENGFDAHYKKSEHQIKKTYDTYCLAELIRENWAFSNKKYNNINGNDIWNILQKKEQYTEDEKTEMIQLAFSILKIKYNIKQKKNIIEQFINLDLD